MKKTFIKTLSLTFAIGVLSLIGFNSAFGYGGGGGGGSSVSYCSNVGYGEWGACVNNAQYRNVISQTPNSCILTTSQQLARSKQCLANVIAPTVVEEKLTVKPEVSTPKTSVLGVKKYADGTLIKGVGARIYVVRADSLVNVLNLQELAKYKGPVLKVSDDIIASFPKAIVLGEKKYADGSLVRAKGDVKIYVIKDGKKVHIKSLAELRAYTGKKIISLSVSDLANY